MTGRGEKTPCFAVIDTETNWADQVMSIGTLIADCDTFSPVTAKYHVITPKYETGAMDELEIMRLLGYRPCDYIKL